MMVSNLLDQWGMEGFEKHVEDVQKFYGSQRDLCIDSMKRWLAGMTLSNE